MQNRIDKLFEERKKAILSIFFTAGFPKLNDTIPVLEALEQSDADMIEIGIPFSDPLADGPIIQQSSIVALENGMNLKLLFQQLEKLRNVSQKPILLMGYLNSVLQFGVENFYEKCFEVGVDGVILPDLPLDEFENHHKVIANKLNIKIVFLISPETKPERVKLLDEASGGFLYLLSSNSTTGGSKGISKKIVKANIDLKNPVLIGFGIKGQKEFIDACENSNGAIIGSAFINVIAKSKNLKKDIVQFIESVKTKLVKS